MVTSVKTGNFNGKEVFHQRSSDTLSSSGTFFSLPKHGADVSIADQSKPLALTSFVSFK